MYSGILISHIFISVLLTFLALYIVVRSSFGMMGKVSFSKFQDIKLSVVVVVFLYLELILGILLYAIYIKELETLITQDNANTDFSARFWAMISLKYVVSKAWHLELFSEKSIRSGV